MKSQNEKAMYFSVPTKLIIGSSENESTAVYERADNLLSVRYATVKGLKEGKRTQIAQVSDVHFNYCNALDFAENDPCIMSTYEHRLWLRGGTSLQNAIRAFEYGSFCDALAVTGDILDYFSHGAIEYTKKYLLEPYPDALVCLGGHDITKKMQGTIPDTTPLEEKLAVLSAIWNHDIYYHSRVINDHVLAIVMFNDHSRYTEDQVKRFSSDIERARKERLAVLVFQHEPISTGNPDDTNVGVIRIGDENSGRNFYNCFAGSPESDEISNRLYKTLVSSPDVVKGVFCGHLHNDIYTEIRATDGTTIPQYTLAPCAYRNGNVLHITII